MNEQVSDPIRDALEDMVWQFSYRSVVDGRLVMHTAGLSALEAAFDALGWEDPRPCPELECDADGCHQEATSGTPTPDGYKRLCSQHYRAIS